MTKSLRYKKKVSIIFVKVKHFIQYFQIVIIEYKTIWDSITLIVALDLLYNNFEMTIASLFYLGNKDFEEI